VGPIKPQHLYKDIQATQQPSAKSLLLFLTNSHMALYCHRNRLDKEKGIEVIVRHSWQNGLLKKKKKKKKKKTFWDCQIFKQLEAA